MKRLLLVAALLAAMPGFAHAYVHERVMVAMRDGTRLDTDILRPSRPGRYPTVLMRTPYEIEDLGEAGLIVCDLFQLTLIQQTTRGRYDSEGVDDVFRSDGWGDNQDGYDTVQWITEQPWSDAQVGFLGASGPGIAAYLAVGTYHPAIKTAHVGIAPWDLYDVVYPGGAFHNATVVDWLEGQGSAYEIELYKQHPVYDAFWEAFALRTREDAIKIPMLHWGGWHDVFSEGPVEAFTALQNGGASGQTGYNRLIMGPWTHVDNGAFSTQQGELSYPDNSLLPMKMANPVEWYLQVMTGREQRPSEYPKDYPVLFYVMGPTDQQEPLANRWEMARAWPLAGRTLPLYFGADGTLTPTKPLLTDAGPLSWSYDPADPSPTIGGRELTIAAGPRDQRPLLSRNDYLLFQTEPLQHPLKVVGEITATLYASSTAYDTDFVARLVDVYPDGRMMLVADSLIKARYRDSMTTPELMIPGTVYAFDVNLHSTAQVFGKGHRLGLIITSSNYRRFEASANTADDVWGTLPPVVALNSLYADAEHPSQIRLPIPDAQASVVAPPLLLPIPADIEAARERLRHGETLSAADRSLLLDEAGRMLMQAMLRQARRSAPPEPR